MISHNFRKRI